MGLGRIIDSEKTEDGHGNILLRGEARARIVEEYPGRPYRCARVELVASDGVSTVAAQASLRRQLCDVVERNLIVAGPREQHLSLADTPLSLGELADLIAGVLPVEGELRQCLLAEHDVCTRARMLLDQIDTLGMVARQARHATQPVAWNFN